MRRKTKITLIVILALICVSTIISISYSWFKHSIDGGKISIDSGKISLSIKGYQAFENESSGIVSLNDSPFYANDFDGTEVNPPGLSNQPLLINDDLNLNIDNGKVADMYFIIENAKNAIDIETILSFKIDGIPMDNDSIYVSENFRYLSGYYYSLEDITSKITDVPKYSSGSIYDRVNKYANDYDYNQAYWLSLANIGQETSERYPSNIINNDSVYCIYHFMAKADDNATVEYSNHKFPLLFDFNVSQIGYYAYEKGNGINHFVHSLASLNEALASYNDGDSICIQTDVTVPNDLIFDRPVNLYIQNGSTLDIKGNLVFSSNSTGKYLVDTKNEGRIIVEFANATGASGGKLLVDLPHSSIEFVGTGNPSYDKADIYIESGIDTLAVGYDESFIVKTSCNTGESTGDFGIKFTQCSMYKYQYYTTADRYGEIKEDVARQTITLRDGSQMSIGTGTIMGEIRVIEDSSMPCQKVYIVNYGNIVGKINLLNMVEEAHPTANPQIRIDNYHKISNQITLPTWAKPYKSSNNDNVIYFEGNTYIRFRTRNADLSVIQNPELYEEGINDPNYPLVPLIKPNGCVYNDTDIEIENAVTSNYVIALNDASTNILVYYMPVLENNNANLEYIIENYFNIAKNYGLMLNKNSIEEMTVITSGDKSLNNSDYTYIKSMSNLVTLDLSQSVSEGLYTANKAFSGLSKLTNVSLPKDTILGTNCFENTNVTEIIIPQTYTTVSSDSLNNLLYVHVRSITPYENIKNWLKVTTHYVFVSESAYTSYITKMSEFTYRRGIFKEAIHYGDYFVRPFGTDQIEIATYVGPGFNAKEELNSSVLFNFSTFKYENETRNVISYDPCAFYNKITTSNNANNDVEINFYKNISRIGYGAFAECSAIRRITVSHIAPAEVEEGIDPQSTLDSVIEGYAFYKCINLKSVNLKNIKTVGAYAFTTESVTTSSLEEIDLNNIVTIGNNAFYASSKLSNVKSTNVSTYGNNVFANCDAFTKIELDGTKKLGEYTFNDCDKLEQFIGKEIEYIDSYSFSSCDNLLVAKIPGLIGDNTKETRVFQDCKNLTILEMGYAANLKKYLKNNTCLKLLIFHFENATKTTNPNDYMLGDSISYAYTEGLRIVCDECSTIPTGGTTYYSHLQSQTLFSNTNSKNCFISTTNITADKYFYVNDTDPNAKHHYFTYDGIYEEDGITLKKYTYADLGYGDYIYGYDGDKCYMIHCLLDELYGEINVPEKVKYNDVEYTFDGFSGKYIFKYTNLYPLTKDEEVIEEVKINVSNNIDHVSAYAFTSTNIKEFNAKDINTIGDYAFDSITTIKKAQFSKIQKIGNYAFNNCTNLENISKFEGIKSIGNNAFINCTSLKKIEFNGENASIGNNAFFNCSLITTLKLYGVKSIGTSAFQNCTHLVGVYGPDVTTVTGSKMFASCTDLKFVNLPKLVSVNQSNTNIISLCSNVTIIQTGVINNVLSIFGQKETSYNPNFTWIINSEYNPSTPTNGSKIWENQTKPTNLRIICNYDYNNYFTPTNTVPSELGSPLLGIDTGSNNRQSVTDINNVTYYPTDFGLGDYVYYKNNNNIYLVSCLFEKLNNSITMKLEDEEKIYSICDNCFKYTSIDAETFNLPNTLYSIGANAFSSSTSFEKKIKTLTITNVNSIGTSAFSAVNVSDVILNNITTIGSSAFTTSKVVNLKLNNVKKINEKAFYQCTLLEKVTCENNIESYGNNAFDGCVKLRTFIFSDSAATIGTSTFSGCTNLINIDLNGVTTLAGSAFSGCSNLIAVKGLNVTKITGASFNLCTSLTFANFPKWVTCNKDSTQVFKGCNDLVFLQTGVLNSGLNTLATSLDSLRLFLVDSSCNPSASTDYNSRWFDTKIPENLMCIYNSGSPFSGSLSKTKTIYDSFEFIDETDNNLRYSKEGIDRKTYYASDCGLGDYVLGIDDSQNAHIVFALLKPITRSYEVPTKAIIKEIEHDIVEIRDNAYWNTSIDFTESTYTFKIDSKIKIGDNAFNTNLSKYKRVFNSLSLNGNPSIGSNAFLGSSFNTLEIKNINTIGTYAFKNCLKFKKLDLTTVKTIGEQAFYQCEGLEEVSFGLEDTSIGTNAFAKCIKLRTITFSDKPATIGSSSFSGCTNLISIDFNGVTTIGSSAFDGCSNLIVVKGLNVTHITTKSFNNCTSLTFANFPKWIKITNTYSTNAFEGCNNLIFIQTGVLNNAMNTLANSLDSLRLHLMDSSFNPSASTDFNDRWYDTKIPENLVAIYKEGAPFSSNITSVKTIYDSFEFISDTDSKLRYSMTGIDGKTYYASDCGLGDYVLGIDDSQNAHIVFALLKPITRSYEVPTKAIIKEIEHDIVEIRGYAYYNTPINLEKSSDEFKINSSITIGNNAFKTNLTKYTRYINNFVLNGNNSIGTKAFEGFSFDKVTIKNSQLVGDSSFINTKINSLSFENVETIDTNAFKACNNLKSLTIKSNSEVKIGNTAFINCTSLESIDLGTSDVIIGNQCFSGCTSLYEVIIDNVTRIGTRAFEKCTSLVKVNANNTKFIGYACFENCSSLIGINAIKCTELGSSDNKTCVFNNCTNLLFINLPSFNYYYDNYKYTGIQMAPNCPNILLAKTSNPPNHTKIFESSPHRAWIVDSDGVTKTSVYYGNGHGISCPIIHDRLTSIDTSSYGGYSISTGEIPTNRIKYCNVDDSMRLYGEDAKGVKHYASEFGFGDYAYYLNENDEAVLVCCFLKEINGNYTTPNELDGHKVVEIFEGAYLTVPMNCDTVTIGSNTVKLGNKVFNNDVSVLGNNPNHHALYISNKVIKSIDLNNVEIIGTSTFQGLTTLEEADVTNVISFTGSNAFKNCSKLASLTFDKLEAFGTTTFAGCKDLSTINLKNDSINQNITGSKLFNGASNVNPNLYIYVFSAVRELVYKTKNTWWEDIDISRIVSYDIEIEYNGFTYYITDLDDHYELTFVTGDFSASNNDFKTSRYCLTLPSIYDGKYITTMNKSLFSGLSNVDTIIAIQLPSELKTFTVNYDFIPKSLQEWIIDRSNKTYSTLDGVLYSNDLMVIISYPCNKKSTSFDLFNPNDPNNIFIIQSGYGIIQTNAFYNVSNLQTINVCIGAVFTNNCFVNCESLKTINILEEIENDILNTRFVGEHILVNCPKAKINVKDTDISEYKRNVFIDRDILDLFE